MRYYLTFLFSGLGLPFVDPTWCIGRYLLKGICPYSQGELEVQDLFDKPETQKMSYVYIPI